MAKESEAPKGKGKGKIEKGRQYGKASKFGSKGGAKGYFKGSKGGEIQGWNKGKGKGKGGKVCYACGEVGHFARDGLCKVQAQAVGDEGTQEQPTAQRKVGSVMHLCMVGRKKTLRGDGGHSRQLGATGRDEG